MKELNKNLKINQGFSLIEILVASVLLGLAIAAILAVLPNGYFIITRSGRVSTMTHLAYQKIDLLKTEAGLNWSHADLTVGDHPAAASARMISGYPGFSIRWTVTAGPGSTGMAMKTITLEAGYRLYQQSNGAAINPADSKAISKTFVTFITANSP